VSPRFVIRREAEEDIENAVKSPENARAGSGRNFLKLVRELLEKIESDPGLFGFIQQGVRATSVRKYHYVIIYRALPDRTEVVAVLHGARDTRHWQQRL
jgi:plasmid stabilization system protein ParE